MEEDVGEVITAAYKRRLGRKKSSNNKGGDGKVRFITIIVWG